MGTPAFARRILEGLLARPDPVVGVVCQPDRPRGRGLAVEAPEVKALALERGLRVLQPEKVRDPALLEALRALSPELVVVAAYGRILPRTILDLPPGVHTLTFALDVDRRKDGLRCELDDVPGSPARVRVVGGK